MNQQLAPEPRPRRIKSGFQKNQVKPIIPVTPFSPKFGRLIPPSEMWD